MLFTCHRLLAETVAERAERSAEVEYLLNTCTMPVCFKGRVEFTFSALFCIGLCILQCQLLLADDYMFFS